MQTANVLLSLGGDHGNTVSKYACTAAEVAVLLAIHGNDSVNEIEPVGEVKRSHREERIRLLNIYGSAKTDEHKPIVENMFPGVAARVFETLDELALDESFYKATGRVKAKPAVAEPVAEPVVEPVAAAEPSADPEAEALAHDTSFEEIEDSVGDDINDEHADKDILG